MTAEKTQLATARQSRLNTTGVPVALLGLCLLAFGVLIPLLGFYWDDWPAIWYLHRLGPAGFPDVFASDRPLLGYLFLGTTALLGESALAWQVFGLLTRLAASLAAFWALSSVWPQQRRQVAWVAFLFAVYPGFKQQWISVTYSNTLVVMAVSLLSLGLSVQAIRKPNRSLPLMAAAWLLAVLALFTDEYFFGLELLRPALLWLATRQELAGERYPDRRARLRKVLVYWSPFLVAIAGFLVWRLLLHPTPRGSVQIFAELGASPLAEFALLVRTILGDMFVSGIGAWLQALLAPRESIFGSIQILLYWGVLLGTAVFIVSYLAAQRPYAASESSAETVNRKTWAKQATLLGLFALFVAGWPFWTTNLKIGLAFPWDRFTLAMMLGACLLLAGLLELLVSRYSLRAVMLGVIIAMSAGLQFQTANTFRMEWNQQKDFFWQLTWRAPGIQPGTILLAPELPFRYFSDNSLTAPLNLVYDPQGNSRQMPYILYDVESRLGVLLPRLEKGKQISYSYRATTFTGTTSQVLGVYYNPPGCVQVLDPALHAHFPHKPPQFDEVLALSDTSLVQTGSQGSQLPASIFGNEPAHGWCYYFEKADLARQQGDWEAVVKLGDQVAGSLPNFYLANAAELAPFIQAYARTGNWKHAAELTMLAHQATFRVDRLLCATWTELEREVPPATLDQAAVAQVKTALQCQPQ